MGIVNRTLDSSQQKDTLQFSQAADIVTGITLQCIQVPSNSTLLAITVAASGLSGTPTYGFGIGRFIVGSGYTFITGGATTITARAFGTSGSVGATLATSGSTLLNLISGDVLTLVSAGSNAAVKQLNVAFVVQNLQDIKTAFGM